jgi:cell division transport system permease protein
MAKGDNKLMRRRLANAYLSSVISISLVLMLVGVACMLLLSARSVSDFFKENMEVSVIMKSEVSEEDALAYAETLKQEGFVRSVTFISKDQGEMELREMLGEDFLDVFETSPVPISLDMTLDASYVSSDSLDVVKSRIQESELVDEVNYQKSLVDALNSNFQRISVILAVFIALLLFISYVLINNTVRLSVFARRFTIHTMKLVGATKSFIRAPFLVQATFQGIFAAVIAIIVLLVIMFFLKNEFLQLFEIFRVEFFLLVMGIVLASGVLICLISTYFVVGKLVSLKKDELYY